VQEPAHVVKLIRGRLAARSDLTGPNRQTARGMCVPKAQSYKASNFLKGDHARGFFPLDSTLAYIQDGEAVIKSHVYDEILDKRNQEASFLTSPVSYALKDSCHLRKLLPLDPISTYFLYNFVLTHAYNYFQASPPGKRRRYGYAFKRRKPISPTDQYHDFRRAKYALKEEYRYFAKVDISNCFNSFYHHDVAQFVGEHISSEAQEQFGQFLREINRGTSVNCFPQGLYPAKTIGNYFLSFIEESSELKSPAIIRFLDDIYLFADSEETLQSDMQSLQQLLGIYNLSLNPDKTKFGSKTSQFDERRLDAVKKRLLRRREKAVGYEDDDWEEIDLEDAERDYLEQIVNEDKVAEEDLELALSLLDEGTSVVRLVELVCDQHPHLIKHVYRLLGNIEYDDDGACWEILQERISRTDLSEYELFWIAKVIQDIYDFNQDSADAMANIYKHAAASEMVKAGILECSHNKHGLLEMKESALRSSAGNAVGVAALMGLRNANRSKRNQLCNYAAKFGPHMHLYSSIVKDL